MPNLRCKKKMEGLVGIVGPENEMIVKNVRVGAHSDSRREFQIVGAAMLKLRAPNKVQT